MILLRSTWSLEILKTVSLWSLLLSVQVLVSELCCSDSLLSSALRVRLTVRLMQPQSTFSNYVIHEFPGHRDKIYSLAWSRDGRKLASGSLDKSILIWPIEAFTSPKGKGGRPQSMLTGHNGDVVDLTWDPSSSDILASGSQDASVRVWDVRSSDPRSTANIKTLGISIYVCYHPKDSNAILAVCYSGYDEAASINVIDVRGAKVVNTVHKHMEVNAIAFSNDGEWLFAAGGEGEIEVYAWPDLAKRADRLEGHTSACTALCLNRAGSHLASGGADSLVMVWDMASKSCEKSFGGSDVPVKHVSFSHDSRYLALAGDEEEKVIMFQDVDASEDDENGFYKTSVEARIDSMCWNPRHYLLAFTGTYVQKNDPFGRTPKGNVGIFSPS